MMTEVCNATSCIMMEVGRATISMMKVRGATRVIRVIVSGNFVSLW